jgi:Flp pilus assembly protein TadG
MVEYALVLPLYLCIFIGVVNASLVMYTWNATAYAARAATRYAIVHGNTAVYVCTATDLQNLVYNSVPGLRKATVTATWSPNNSPGSTINIYVKLTFSTFVPFIKSQSLALASSSQMTIIQ